MKERLQKIIAARGVCSRRRAEELITAGKVTVDGITATLGQTADPDTQDIRVEGDPLPALERKVYLMLHKPRGCVTTLSDEKARPNAAKLVEDCGVRVYPVGRLDMDSEGLLLFTNDGDFANTLMHPKHQVEKVYRVWVEGYAPESFERLKRPVVLDGYRIRPPKLRLIEANGDRAVLQVTIHEGRNRQVRRMCDAAGMHVWRLKRIAEGSLRLGDLKLGAWRYLTAEEVSSLLQE